MKGVRQDNSRPVDQSLVSKDAVDLYNAGGFQLKGDFNEFLD